ISVIVRSHCGSSEIDSGKESTRTRVRQDLGVQLGIRCGLSCASDRTSCGSGARSNSEFVFRQLLLATLVLDNQNAVRLACSNLETDAAALYNYCGRPTPSSIRTADENSFAIFCSYNESCLFHTGNNPNALGLTKNFLRYALIGSTHDLIQNSCSVRYALDSFTAGVRG